MAYADKIAQATALLEEHNRNIPDGEEGRVDVEGFKKNLRKAGGTTEDALGECSWEDLENCGLPRLLARKVAVIFRAKATSIDAVQVDRRPLTRYISDKQVANLSVRELVENYDPNPLTGSPHVTNRLKALVGDSPVVLLNANGSVNAEVTAELVHDKINGLPDRNTFDVDGKPQLLLKIGQQRPTQVDENPAYAGEPLRSDGTCPHTDASWKDVPMIVRQLAYVVFNGTKDRVADDDSVHDMLDFIHRDLATAESRLRKRFRQASLMLDQMLGDGNAPVLRVRLFSASPTPAPRRPNDPFYGAGSRHHSY